jgi:hypothetical protein
MADDSTTEAAPDAKKGVEMAQQSINPASSAGLASCITALILLLLVVGTILYVWLVDSSLIPAGMAWSWPRLLLVAVLLIVIPIVVFRAVTLWVMGVGPRFVDIDFSWRAGIEALAKRGMDLKSAPLFVIVGGGSDRLRKNLMSAVGTEFIVNGEPDVPAPLHWYASKDAIYLYLDNASWTNMAARRHRIASQQQQQGRPGPALPGDSPASGKRPIISTLMPGAGMSGAEPTQTLSGQSVPDLFSGGPKLPTDETIAPTAPKQAAPARRPAYIGTLSPDAVAPVDIPTAGGARPAAPVARRGRPSASAESSLQLRRLEAVCSKLRLHRQPVCPVNGMLVLLPFDLLQASRADIEEVERALAGDLATAKRELQLRCPVTALVVAMEQEKGFCELIRRLGRDHAAKQRFGQRFDIRREATVEELRKFATYACGVFEDWVYTLFRDEKVLSHPGNPSLYNLLCKVRRSFQARLSDVLSKGFGYDPHSDSEPLYFSGCYFAATGSQPEKQAFVSGVLAKLREEQEELEWTEDALVDDSRRGLIAIIGWVSVLLLAIALGLLMFWF